MRAHLNLPRVVALIAAAAIAGGLVACGGDDRDDAESTAQAAIDAANDRDQDALLDLVCPDVREQLDELAELAGDDFDLFADAEPEERVELIEVTETDDRATATTRTTGGEDGDPEDDLHLRRDDGEWCLDFASTDE